MESNWRQKLVPEVSGLLEKALEFTAKVAEHLDEIGGEYKMLLSESENIILHGVRRSLQLNEANVFYSKSLENL